MDGETLIKLAGIAAFACALIFAIGEGSGDGIGAVVACLAIVFGMNPMIEYFKAKKKGE